MPLKDSTETKRWAVKKVEEVGGVVGPRPSHGDESTALSRHARGLGAELGEEELPPELECGEDSDEAFAQGHEGGHQHHRVGGEVARLEAVEL